MGLHILTWAHLSLDCSNSLLLGPWCPLCPQHLLPHLCSQRAWHSTNLIILLFSLETRSFSQDKEKLCPGLKPWGLVLSNLCGCISQCILLPHAHPSGHSLLPQGLCTCFFLSRTLFTIPFCLITPVHHSALTVTSLGRKPDLPDHPGLLIISPLGTMSLFMTSLSTDIIYIGFVITCFISVSSSTVNSMRTKAMTLFFLFHFIPDAYQSVWHITGI